MALFFSRLPGFGIAFLRCLKRHISRAVYKTMVRAERARAGRVLAVDFTTDPLAVTV
ncbi:MAG: hypothetical protein Q7J82_00275 [Coriobacteriia bacterium]|nr:hypothetical protein [Coriobacteriia bacterium]